MLRTLPTDHVCMGVVDVVHSDMSSEHLLPDDSQCRFIPVLEPRAFLRGAHSKNVRQALPFTYAVYDVVESNTKTLTRSRR